MPFLSLQTTASLDNAARSTLAHELANLVSRELGKPVSYVQVQLQLGAYLSFGDTEEPSAFVELRSLGFPAEKAPALSEVLSQIIQEKLGIPPNRVFLNFQDIPRSHWGWNGQTFA